MNDSITIMVQLDISFVKESIYENSKYNDFDTHEQITYTFVKPLLKKYFNQDKIETYLNEIKKRGFHVRSTNLTEENGVVVAIYTNYSNEMKDLVDQEFKHFTTIMGM